MQLHGPKKKKKKEKQEKNRTTKCVEKKIVMNTLYALIERN